MPRPDICRCRATATIGSGSYRRQHFTNRRSSVACRGQRDPHRIFGSDGVVGTHTGRRTAVVLHDVAGCVRHVSMDGLREAVAERLVFRRDATPFTAPHFVEMVLAGAGDDAPARIATTIDGELQAEISGIIESQRSTLKECVTVWRVGGQFRSPASERLERSHRRRPHLSCGDARGRATICRQVRRSPGARPREFDRRDGRTLRRDLRALRDDRERVVPGSAARVDPHRR